MEKRSISLALAVVCFGVGASVVGRAHPIIHTDGDPVPPRGDFGVFTEAFAAGAGCFIDDRTPADQFAFRTEDERAAICGPNLSATTRTQLTPLDATGDRSVWQLDASTVALCGAEPNPAEASADEIVEDTFLVTSTGPAAVVIKKHVTSFIARETDSGDYGYDAWTDAYLIDEQGGLHALRLTHPPNPAGFDVDVTGSSDETLDRDFTILFPPLAPGSIVLVDAGIDLLASGPLPMRVSIASDMSVCPAAPGVSIDSLSGATGNCKDAGDVAILDIDAVQSVFKPSVLIAGKDTVIAVDVANTSPDAVEATIKWSVTQNGATSALSDFVSIPGNCPSKRIYLPKPSSEVMDICSVPSEPQGTLLQENLEPIEGSNFEVTARIEAESANDGDPTNDERSASFPVERTVFAPAFTRIDCHLGNCSQNYGAIDDSEYAQAVFIGNEYIQAMFPLGVVAGDFSPTACTSRLACGVEGDDEQCTGSSILDCPGILTDYQNVKRTLRRLNPTASAFGAYVPAGYLLFHGYGSNLAGALFTGGDTILPENGPPISLVRTDLATGNSVLVPGQKLAVTPHEMVHSLDFDLAHTDAASHGFWVGCPYVSCVAGSTNLMTAASSLEPPHDWIDADTYALLASDLRAVADPTILDISARITRDGKITIEALDELPGGRPDASHPGGESSIRLLDSAGNVVAENVGGGDFDHPTAEPGGKPWQTLPIGCALEYPQSATALEFRRGSTVLLRIDPMAWTLRSQIQGIPDRGFDKNPIERRKALLAKVDAFEKSVDQKAYQGALQQLDHDIRDSVAKWVVPSYPNPRVLDSTQASVLAQIDRLDARLNYLQGAHPAH